MNRRQYLQSSILLGAAVGSARVLAACGNDAPKKAELSCTDVAGLAPADVQVRTSLEYVDKTTDAAKPCLTCRFYVAPQTEGCGTCQIVKGPIHPTGGCKSWIAKA